MLRYSVPLSTSLIWANHSLHMPFQTILAFCIIFPTIHLSVFSKEIGPLIHTCTHFSLALKCSKHVLCSCTSYFHKCSEKICMYTQYTAVGYSVDSCSWFCSMPKSI